jgi:2-dehydro-3-deoxyphosphogluconate aldolase/(4S)-4-hydroxy-2-oxoglutarate aldolase
MTPVLERIGVAGIVPVVVIDHAADAEPLGAALLDAGLEAVEVTFRTPAAAAAVERMAKAFPSMIVGAGTVVEVGTAEAAIDNGARFVVSPALDAKVVRHCLGRGVTVIPGALTPTEIAAAAGLGLDVVKLFPAEPAGGTAYLEAVSAPFGRMKFFPTGGISEKNLAAWLRLPSVLACGGSWMVKRELIAGGKFGEITRLGKAALEIVAATRSGTGPGPRG